MGKHHPLDLHVEVTQLYIGLRLFEGTTTVTSPGLVHRNDFLAKDWGVGP